MEFIIYYDCKDTALSQNSGHFCATNHKIPGIFMLKSQNSRHFRAINHKIPGLFRTTNHKISKYSDIAVAVWRAVLRWVRQTRLPLPPPRSVRCARAKPVAVEPAFGETVEQTERIEHVGRRPCEIVAVVMSLEPLYGLPPECQRPIK